MKDVRSQGGGRDLSNADKV